MPLTPLRTGLVKGAHLVGIQQACTAAVRRSIHGMQGHPQWEANKPRSLLDRQTDTQTKLKSTICLHYDSMSICLSVCLSVWEIEGQSPIEAVVFSMPKLPSSRPTWSRAQKSSSETAAFALPDLLRGRVSQTSSTVLLTLIQTLVSKLYFSWEHTVTTFVSALGRFCKWRYTNPILLLLLLFV